MSFLSQYRLWNGRPRFGAQVTPSWMRPAEHEGASLKPVAVKRWCAVLLFGYGALMLPASSAEAPRHTQDSAAAHRWAAIRTPIDVRVVQNQDPACAPARCPAWIALEGQIGPGSAAAFARVLRQTAPKRLPILIDSPGGLVEEAMSIGRLIRSRHLDVEVSRTVLTTCAAVRDACGTQSPDGKTFGRPEPRNAQCASACPLILAAGTRRFVPSQASVGVHQYVGFMRQVKVMRFYRIITRTVDGQSTTVSKTLVSEKPVPHSATLVRTKASYDVTESYYARMGIKLTIMPFLRAASPDGMSWLHSGDLLETGLATDLGDDRDLQPPVQEIPEFAVRGIGLTGKAPLEIAALVEDEGDKETTYAGRATWSVWQEMTNAGQPGTVDLLATAALDDDKGTLYLRIARRPADAAVRALSLEAVWRPGRATLFQHDVFLGVPAMRADPHAGPTAFLGRIEPAKPSMLTLDLADSPADALSDLALLLSDQWIDVPVMDGGRTYKVTLALGLSGRQAVQTWRSVPLSGAR